MDLLGKIGGFIRCGMGPIAMNRLLAPMLDEAGFYVLLACGCNDRRINQCFAKPYKGGALRCWFMAGKAAKPAKRSLVIQGLGQLHIAQVIPS